jgi:hypothetical protein
MVFKVKRHEGEGGVRGKLVVMFGANALVKVELLGPIWQDMPPFKPFSR